MVAVGVDGCRKGWFYFRFDDGTATFGVVSTLGRLLEGLPDDARVLVDIPIGLREGGDRERLCDLEARRMLAPYRGSSVFPAPCRQAVYAASYQEAAALNRKVLGRGLSKQSWFISPKIREVDELLRASSRFRGMLRETHPEVCFRGLTGAPMAASKKSREGFRTRLKALMDVDGEAEALIGKAFLKHGGFDALRDDIVDAYVAALCARKIAWTKTLPAEPEMDGQGLPMAIVYFDATGD